MKTYELTNNHQEIYEIFNQFNKLISDHEIDYYYTGGIMIYIVNNISLKRYHSDLDILINEKSLRKLFNVIRDNPDFRVFNNLKTKRKGGHEFKILYKNYQVSIGLILFERTIDNKIIKKEYYYDEKNNLNEISEIHSKENIALQFDDKIKIYNNIPYKCVTLESIYINKLENREKDLVDKKILENKIDKKRLEKLLQENIIQVRQKTITNKRIIDILENN